MSAILPARSLQTNRPLVLGFTRSTTGVPLGLALIRDPSQAGFQSRRQACFRVSVSGEVARKAKTPACRCGSKHHAQTSPTRPQWADFTPIELEFLKWVWVWKLWAEGATVDDDLRHVVLAKTSARSGDDAIRKMEEMRELFGGHVPVKLLNKRDQFRINRRNEQDLDQRLKIKCSKTFAASNFMTPGWLVHCGGWRIRPVPENGAPVPSALHRRQNIRPKQYFPGYSSKQDQEV